MKVTGRLNREHAGLKLGPNTIDSIAQQLPVIRFSIGLVGQPAEALHQGEEGRGDARLLALLGGDPVDLTDRRVGVQVTVHDGDPAVVHGDLTVLQALGVTHGTVWRSVRGYNIPPAEVTHT